jgi:glucose/arabinose dehydrogenase
MKWIWLLFLVGGAHAQVEKLTVAEGYKIKQYAKVPGARSLAVHADGTLFVSTGGFSNALDRIYRIRDWDRDGSIGDNEVEVLISGLNNPNGIALKGNDLYVAEIDQILQFRGAVSSARNSQLKKDGARVLPQKFPTDVHHGWKFIRFAPPPNDKWLYVPVGAPCNICKPPRPIYSAIHRIDVTGDAVEVVARGVRNTVGFDFDPKTKNLWFTDNGRDNLGDNTPPDELNEVTKFGEHFGYPYCHGKGIVDPEIGFDSTIRSCGQTIAPKAELGAHVAALGMRFYKNQIVIAEHGSWNRARKNGYRVSSVTFSNGTPTYKSLVSGWLDENTQKVWGRPVDVEPAKDGSLFISDDGVRDTPNPGAVYLLTPKK